MIALVLIAIGLVYLGLFVVAGIFGKDWRARFVWWLLLLSPVIWFTWDMPFGYFMFRRACATEGGLRVFHAVQKVDGLRLGSGLWDIDAEEILRQVEGITIVEARDHRSVNGRYFDYMRGDDGKVVRRPPTTNSNRPPYLIEKSDTYEGIRLRQMQWRLKGSDNQVIASWTSFEYLWSNPNHTLLGGTWGKGCFSRGPDHRPPFVQLAKFASK